MSFIIEPGGGSASPILNAIALDFAMDSAVTVKIMNFTTSAILATFPANVCSAVANGATDITIEYSGGEEKIVNKLPITAIKIEGVLQTGTQAAIMSLLNALFANAGGGVAPTITSGNINIPTGGNINYQLTGTNVVAWSWDSLPDPSVVTQTGNSSKLIGGSALSAGTYTAVARATNYHGFATKSITITVASPTLNAYSWQGSASSHFDTGATFTQNNTSPFYMASGTSTGAAWTIFYWVKHLSTDSGGTQRNIISFGECSATSLDAPRDGLMIHSRCWASPHNFVRSYLRIGLHPNTVYLSSPGFTRDVWHSVMYTYDGTDINSSSAASFKVAIDGVDVTSSGLPGFSGTGHGGGIHCSGIGANNTHQLGRAPLTNFVKISELVTFSGDLISDASTFHSGGGAFDFTPYNPKQWYRFGDDGDYAAFPLMTNKGSLANVDMTSTGTIAEYVNDVP